jgi:O-antigen ligase
LNWDQGAEDGKPVRSPHNVAMTVFARTGLIGLAAWLLVLVTSFVSIVRGALACRRRGDRDAELFGVWLIIYLLAMLLIALLGVVLESPFGAAPFFWVIGVGLAWGARAKRSDAMQQPEHGTSPLAPRAEAAPCVRR